MKKWFRFFCLSFFSHKISKEGSRQGYGNAFLGFVLALAFLWAGFLGGDMLPFGTHYNNSQGLRETAHAIFANADTDKRIIAEIENGDLKVKNSDGEYIEGLIVNTFGNDTDNESYSAEDFNAVVDLRPSDTLAEVEAYYVSNDGKNTVISYEDYLTLSDVARLNFDFRLRYTGNALELTDSTVASYREYLDGLGDEIKGEAEKLSSELAENKITKTEYNRSIYQLYFTNYYPEITKYENTSKVPLLRNYYYHQYVSEGASNYLFVFDDYMMGSFLTKSGTEVVFYGFYSDLENGALITDGASHEEACELVDDFIKDAFFANCFLNAYAHVVNMFSFMPFIALMLMVATLLSYSLLKLLGVESVSSLGAMLKIVGSFVWVSGLSSALFAVVIGFFVKRNLISALSLVLFFVVLVARSIVFVIKENKLYIKQSERETEHLEA